MKPILSKKFIYEEDTLEDNLERNLHIFRMKSKALNKINIYYLCKDIMMDYLISIQSISKNYQYVEISKTVHIFQGQNEDSVELIFILKFGVIIFWFVSNEEQQVILQELEPLMRKKCKQITEEYEVFFNVKMQKIISEEVFYLEEEESDIMIVSYTLAQYLILKRFQEDFQKNIQTFNNVIKRIQKEGSKGCSEKQCFQYIGQAHLLLNELTQKLNNLDAPNFLTSREISKKYHQLSTYFNIANMQ